MSDTSGLSLQAPFAIYDPGSSCWRTSQGTFLSGSDEFLGTWPRRGMCLGGRAYELPTSEHRMAGSASSSSLLPTPTTEPTTGNGHARNLGAEAKKLLPTPRTSDTNGPGKHGTGGLDLRTAVTLLPTPRATDGTKGGPNQRGSKGDLMLPLAVSKLLPTPSAADGMGGHERRGGSRGAEPLLPGVAKQVAGTMGPALRESSGATTSPPSDDGSESSDDQLHLPLMSEDG